MKKQGSFTPPKAHINSITVSKDNQLAEMSGKEFKSLFLKRSNDHKKDSDEQVNKGRKSIRHLDKTVSNVDEKFSKKMEIVGE
jgi:hypothetical protein